MRFISKTEAETEAAGEYLAERLKSGDVVALRGDLGAGKTVFTRGLAQGLDIDARVTSPTYTVVNEYEGRTALFHFDMYRLSGPDELYDIGWDDYLKRPGVCVVEWSERAEGALPDGLITVTIKKNSDSEREILIEGVRE